ncbi:MAG: hypothetical protein ABIB43_02390 [archaeon]
MNFLARDFLMASGGKHTRTTVKVNKDGKTHTFLFQSNDSLETLKKELATAEKLFRKVKGKLSKDKLMSIKGKINSLRTKLKAAKVKVSGSLEYKGASISSLMFEELEDELQIFDEEFAYKKKIDTVEPEELTEPVEEVQTEESSIHLLNLPPPPKK